MTECRGCQLTYAGSACPGCGAKPGMSTQKKVGFVVIVVVVAIAGAVSSSRHGPPRSIRPSAGGSAPATP